MDDGSTDNTLNLVKKYKHLKLIKLNRNYGQPGAMFHSKVLTNYRRLCNFIRSDDYLLPNVRDKIVL